MFVTEKLKTKLKSKSFLLNPDFLGFFLALIIFYIDLKVELGIAVGVLFAAVVLVGLFLYSPNYFWRAALLSSLLIIIGLFMSDPGGEYEKVLWNRGLSIVVVWLSAFCCYREIQVVERFIELNDRLEDEKEKQEKKLDATARRLEGNEQILSSLIHHIAEGLIIFDDEGKIFSINLAGQKIFGFSNEEIVGESIMTILPGPSIARSDLYMVHFLKSGFSDILDRDFEIYGNKKTGEKFPVLVSMGKFSGEAGEMYSSVVRDITDQKKEIQEKEKQIFSLTLANKELENFAHIISHDLKEPVRGIVSNVEWILEENNHDLGEPLNRYFDLLKGNSKRLQTLIRGILEYCKYGISASVLIPVDTKLLIREVVESLPHPQGIIISTSGEFPVVTYNRTQLSQVFQNLVQNAIKYMGKPNGNIKIDCIEEPEFWRFFIEDTGIGIEERHFERIFHMFKTLSGKKERNSAGVGLAIVKKIVEFYGGTVGVDSKMDKGTTFYFTIPKNMPNLKLEKASL